MPPFVSAHVSVPKKPTMAKRKEKRGGKKRERGQLAARYGAAEGVGGARTGKGRQCALVVLRNVHHQAGLGVLPQRPRNGQETEKGSTVDDTAGAAGKASTRPTQAEKDSKVFFAQAATMKKRESS
jgi:hypothetical protein